MPAMLVKRDTRFPARSDASLSRISPVGRSMESAGALGLEGEEKMYESGAVWTLMSRKGSAMVEKSASSGDGKRGTRRTNIYSFNCGPCGAENVQVVRKK